MKRKKLSIALEEETLRYLSVLGDPNEVLAELAAAAAEGVRGPAQPVRELTDESLRVEREKADSALLKKRQMVEQAADEVVRVARQRADSVVQTARDVVDTDRSGESGAAAGKSRRERGVADSLLREERSAEDKVLKDERREKRGGPEAFLAIERDETDKDLAGERALADALTHDQLEANEHMLQAAINAQEMAAQAEEARDQLHHSERELLAVAEVRELFIGILGHELRNPLGSIGISAALLLRRGHLDQQDSETVARIIRSGQQMTRRITQLLDLTRSRLGGGLPIEPGACDLRQICRNVVEDFDATIQTQVEGDLTGVWDGDRLSDALSNIVGNAIQFATPGTPVVVHAFAEETDAVVEISNKGEPIPETLLPVIFEPFRGANQHVKSRAGNLGLGLYIASQIVNAHGGTLTAACAGGTTTFVMKLPRPAPAVDRPSPAPGGSL